MKSTDDYIWYSLLEKSPNNDGLYYAFVSNCMDNSSAIRKIAYKDSQWDITLDKYTKILAWKKIPNTIIEEETEWLNKHILEIRTVFNHNEIECEDCCIAETLEECLCEYEYFLWEGYVRFIDGIFVIRVF